MKRIVLPKIGIIQEFLQTFNGIFQNIKISTFIYSVCLCVCVNRSPETSSVTK